MDKWNFMRSIIYFKPTQLGLRKLCWRKSSHRQPTLMVVVMKWWVGWNCLLQKEYTFLTDIVSHQKHYIGRNVNKWKNRKEQEISGSCILTSSNYNTAYTCLYNRVYTNSTSRRKCQEPKSHLFQRNWSCVMKHDHQKYAIIYANTGAINMYKVLTVKKMHMFHKMGWSVG